MNIMWVSTINDILCVPIYYMNTIGNFADSTASSSIQPVDMWYIMK